MRQERASRRRGSHIRGFQESGKEGYRLERKLAEVAAEHSIRVLGPNCLGLADSLPHHQYDFREQPTLQGARLLLQSGALCTAVLGWSQEIGLGFPSSSRSVTRWTSTGVDLLEALEDDWHSAVIAGYLEGIKRGGEFLRLARSHPQETGDHLQAGTTQAGAKAVSSHAGTLGGSEKRLHRFIQADRGDPRGNHGRPLPGLPRLLPAARAHRGATWSSSPTRAARAL